MRGNSPDIKDRSPCVPICEYSDGAYIKTYEGIADIRISADGEGI